MSMIVIMPGGFHPFHAGHFALYQSAKQAFPNADVYVAATNDMSERPFPFALKEKLAKLAGVDAGHFIQVKSPFKAEEITKNYDPNSDVLVFVRSEKDRNEQPKPGGTKKDGSPAYFQPWTGKNVQPFSKHAYMAYLPTVEFGPGITSATQIRKAWPTLNDKRKTALVMSLYPATQKNSKLAQNVVGMFDQVMGGQQGVAEAVTLDRSKNPNYPNDPATIKHRIDTAKAILSDPKSDTDSRQAASAILAQHKDVAEGSEQNLSVQQLATISDEALDKAYGYGRSNPGNTFGWQANLMSAAYAKKMIDAGVTDIEKISDAIHKGWNVTAQKFVQNPDQFDDTEKLRQAGKLEAKLAQRAKLMKINYGQLDNEEQEKDRVVARALLQAIKGQQGVAEDKSKVIARTAKDLENPPKIMQHRAKRDQEREETYRNAQFGRDDLDDEGDLELQQLMRKAQQHYPTMPGKQQAFIKFVQRALKHSEEEDNQQDKEINQIKSELNQIQQDHKKIMKVSESSDYLEEK